MIDCQMILINKKNDLKEKRREAVSYENRHSLLFLSLIKP